MTGLAFTCLLQGSHALEPGKSMSQYVHSKWGKEKGFVGGIIYAISQSDDGYLWLGTDRGLVRFDGERFTLIQRPISGQPETGPVRGLVMGSDGTLWIRPQGPQLLQYRGGQFKNLFGSLGLPATTITAMGTDNQGDVLFSGLYSQPMRYAGGKFERLPGAAEASSTLVTSIAETRDGRIWIGTREDGLFVIKDGKRVSSEAPNLVNHKINALAPSNNGGLWIGTDQGLRFLSAGVDVSVRTPRWNGDNQILAITKDISGNIWAASSGGLIRVTPGRDFSILPGEGRRTAAVTAVFVDSEGSIWFGGPEGLERLQDSPFTTYASDDGVPESNGGALFADAGNRTWFAPVSGGLYCLDHGRLNRIQLEGLDHDVVYSISGRGNDIWVGRQRGGLTRITRIENKLSAKTYTEHDGLAQNTVYATYAAHDGAVWAGTISDGLSRIKDSVLTTYSMSNGLNSNAINSIVEGYDGTIWVGTPAGLSAFRNGVWSTWTTTAGLPAADVRNCFEDSKHILWAVTASGLAYLSGQRFVVPGHLPDQLRDQIFGLTEDALGFLWLSTTDSVIRVNRDRLITGSLRASDIRVFGESDGLAGAEGVRRERSILTDKSGSIWVSVKNGIAKGDSMMILENQRPIRVRIESIDAAGRTFPGNESPRIAARTRSVTFHFSAISLDSPDQLWYRYLLEGADQDWSDPMQLRQVSYNNLGAHAYRFRVMASHDGVLWNGQESEATFSIDHTFWEAWWFRTCSLLALALLVVFVFRLRTIRLSRQLNARFQERLAERTRIAQELHDTLLQSFQGLMLRFQTVDTMLPRQPGEAKTMLEDALERADDALTESRDAIQNIRSSPARHPNLSHALASVLEEVQGAFPDDGHARPACSIVVVGREQLLREYVVTEICRIAREALRNAFQHAQAGHFEMEISFSDSELRLSLRDDGVGIEPLVLSEGARSGHWGLIGMRERAARLGALLDFWSKPGAGTEIELSLSGEIAYASPHTSFFGRFHKRMKP
jgi:signal transduction histidine kinase/ligand-binding sensor domain-containing protein